MAGPRPGRVRAAPSRVHQRDEEDPPGEPGHRHGRAGDARERGGHGQGTQVEGLLPPPGTRFNTEHILAQVVYLLL